MSGFSRKLQSASPSIRLTTYDAVSARALAHLNVFTNWLSANGVQGYVGEYGWPGTSSAGTDTNYDSRWDIVADQWLRAIDKAGLHATNWVSSDWSINLHAYRNISGDSTPLTIATSVASVIEKHMSTASFVRGVNLAGADFGDYGPNGALNKGTLGSQYIYPNTADWAFLHSHGVRLVRMPIRWERVQPTLKQPLNSTELGYITNALSDASAVGIGVLLDIHNYGRYDTAANGNTSGSTAGVYMFGNNAPATVGGTMASCFADLWSRVATALSSHAGLWGYGLCNEPHDLPSGASSWQTASIQATEAIRLIDTTNYISVGGYSYSTIPDWFNQNGSTAWLTTTIPNGQPNAGQQRNHDPKLIFEGHHYWDTDHSGSYLLSYDNEITSAQNQGFTSYRASTY